MSVCRYLDCSTGHLTRAQGEAMRSGGIDGEREDPYEYGWWIWAPSTMTTGEREETADTAPQVLALIDRARDAGCQHLRLDADAVVLDGLPTYEW